MLYFCILSPVCKVVVSVSHVDQTLDEVGTLHEAEEHLKTNRQTIKSQTTEDQRCCFDIQLEEHLPPSDEGCASLCRALRWTCGICPATPVCVGSRRGQTKRRHHGRPGLGLQGPPQTGRSTSAGRPGSPAATAEENRTKTTSMRICWTLQHTSSFRNSQIKPHSPFTLRLRQFSLKSLSHHSPGLLVFWLQDAGVENLQKQLQTSR